jgi:hypothetical protein
MKPFRITLVALMVLLIPGFPGCRLDDDPADPGLTAIIVSSLPGKTVYNLGDTFNPAGLEITGTWSNGTEEPVTDYTLSPVDTSTEGTKTVTVAFGELTTTFTIRVRPPGSALVSIEVSALPDKTSYAIGETFDSSGLVVTGTWSDETEEPVTGYTLSPVDTSAEGTKTVTITLGELSATFTIRVRSADSILLSIRVSALPDKTSYTIGETFDPSGLVVTGTWSDETEEPLTGYTLSPVDTSVEGIKTVTVSLNGLEDTFTVTVGEARLVSIEITALPEKRVYRGGESFSEAGLVVTGTYEDGSKRVETAYTTSPVDTTSAGEKTVTISLGNFTAEFTIFVSSGELLSIAISREPDQGQSWGGAIDLSGMEVTGIFSNFPDTPVAIPVSPANVSGYDPTLLPGEQTLTITVEGKTASFTTPVSALFFDFGKPRPRGEAPSESYSVPLGRTLVLTPVRWGIGDNAVYEWKVDGVVQPGAVTECFSFRPRTRGEYTLSVSARDGRAYAETSVRVRCVDREGTYKRSKTSASKAYTTDFHGYFPAPGQFTGIQVTWDPANAGTNYRYSLGAFGGSVVYGFDHSVENNDGYSMIIYGNPLSTGDWDEPGTVWVMQDENGNGEPDDTWYELAGSETGKPAATQRYAVAYTAENFCIDNIGDTIEFPYSTYYGDGYGFPSGAGQYVIYSGTRLMDKLTIIGGFALNEGYEWGYVDNIGSGGLSSFGFRISDAIQTDGSPANLKYIDFVRVQCAVLKHAAQLGEISTEIGIAYDYSMYY